MKLFNRILLSVAIALAALSATAQVRIIDVYQNGVVSQSFPVATVDSITFREILEVPTSLTATLSEGAVVLNWEIVSGATSYEVFRSADNATYISLATDINTNTYTDLSPLTGMNYYKVRAVSSKLVSELSEASAPVENVKESEFIYYNQDGIVSTNAPIDKATRTANTKGLFVFTFGNTDSTIANNYYSVFSSLKLIIHPDFINAGVIDLSALEANTFEIKTPYFTLYSPDNAYKGTPNNGTLEVTRDDAGNYTISLDVQNYYTKGESEVQGDPQRAVIYYNGAVTEQ